MINEIIKKIVFSTLLVCMVTAASSPLTEARPKKAASTTPIKKIEILQPSAPEQLIKKARISWEALPNAVFYELIILNGKDLANSRVLYRKNDIAATGVEVDLRFNRNRDNLYWRVRALDINKNPLGEYTSLEPLDEQEINPHKMKTTTEYSKMKYMKAYPVYSWVPSNGAAGYDLQVYKDEDFNRSTPDRLIKSVHIDNGREFDYYEDYSYTQAGLYWWRIRGTAVNGRIVEDWSDKEYFMVRKGAAIAALGDSITHGGGAVSAPPSDLQYDWESYTGKEIRNLGYSGNTVESMLNRFDRDVLADKPKVLVVFGGINNIRCGDKAEQVINSLNNIRLKCLANGIKPMFITIAPINPAKMKLVSGLDTAATWKGEQQKINNWIMSQPYHLDITKPLSDKRGWLKDELATDGLHPDIEGKKIIGMAIGSYIEEVFDL